MSSPPTSLPPAPAGALAGGMARPRCWPVVVASTCAALGLAGLAWQTAGLDAGNPWSGGALGLAAAVLPLWLGRQLWRQSNTVAGQALRLQHQDNRLQSLGRSAERLGLAEQVAQLGSFDWDPNSGALHRSDQHFRLWGHAPGALPPDDAAFRARIHPDDLGALEGRLQHALQTGASDAFTHRVVWPDGTLREVLARGDVTRDAGGRALRMATSLEHLRLTLNATGDAIVASDAAGPHAPLLFVNHRMLQLWRIPPAQAAGLTPAGLMAAARPFFTDPVRETARVHEMIASGTLQEDRLTLNDGRVLLRRCIPTALAGRPVRVWSLRDITIEARALAGLRAAEVQQRALLAACPGDVTCISAEQRFTHADDRLAALLETTPQALIDQPVTAITRADAGQAPDDATPAPADPSATPPATPPATPSTAAAQPAPAGQPAAAAPGAPLRVLYIDDNPVNTLLMAAMFERLPGLQLRCESDPHQGLALALADPPALLLVDIQMPGMDGYQLLRRLRADAATRDVPAVAVSANAMPQDLVRGRAAGFVDYLTKPLDLLRLQAALQAVLPGWSAPG